MGKMHHANGMTGMAERKTDEETNRGDADHKDAIGYSHNGDDADDDNCADVFVTATAA